MNVAALKTRRRIIAVLPAYNAARTLEMTLREIPREIVDATILVDDASQDSTWDLAGQFGIAPCVIHIIGVTAATRRVVTSKHFAVVPISWS
jgi:hypothetical protein